MKLIIKKFKEDVQVSLPETAGSAAIDLRCYWESGEPGKAVAYISKNEMFLGHTGIAAEIPEGYYGLIAIRSSAAVKQGLMLVNNIGVIDSDYRGEIMLPLTTWRHGAHVVCGERVAQLIISPYEKVDVIEEVQELSETKRGTGGIGSTGTL